MENATLDDDLLRRYLVGSLGEEEAERLDELSVTDDEVALRLRAVENDLVDSYARGELSGEMLRRFESAYLSSPQRREKVQIAKALASRESVAAASHVSAFSSPHMTRWAIAASIIAVTAAGYLLFEPRQGNQQVPNEIAVGTMTPQRESAPSPPLKSVSFTLPAPTRGAAAPRTLTIPPDTQQVTLQLQLESNDFSRYHGALRNLRTQEIIWTSDPATAASDRPSVSIAVPAGQLKQENYSLELSGLPENGTAELIASYAFRIQ